MAPAGLFFGVVNLNFLEPNEKRAIAFLDGQNLYRHAKVAFGHIHPNYDPKKLFSAVCHIHGWKEQGVRFYTGVPGPKGDPMWQGYWSNRLLQMRRSGIMVTTRELRYHNVVTKEADGTEKTQQIAHEKGIDVRLALDVVRLARQKQYDVAVIFSQDQDLAEVVSEVKEIAKEQTRWIKIVSAFPSGPAASASRGVDGTDWFKIEQPLYDANLDPRDYRPKTA
jgi:uncharacterized LabA/DUF88 family protein